MKLLLFILLLISAHHIEAQSFKPVKPPTFDVASEGRKIVRLQQYKTWHQTKSRDKWNDYFTFSLLLNIGCQVADLGTTISKVDGVNYREGNPLLSHNGKLRLGVAIPLKSGLALGGLVFKHFSGAKAGTVYNLVAAGTGCAGATWNSLQ